MSRKRLSLRTVGIIEHMWSRGISAVSIAGSTQARLDRVREVIAQLERSASAREAERWTSEADDAERCYRETAAERSRANSKALAPTD